MIGLLKSVAFFSIIYVGSVRQFKFIGVGPEFFIVLMYGYTVEMLFQECFCSLGKIGIFDRGNSLCVGENAKDNDIVVNVTKSKKLTNMRASGADDKAL